MSLHEFSEQRALVPTWCQICSGIIFSFALYQHCDACQLTAHHECVVGLPATCNLDKIEPTHRAPSSAASNTNADSTASTKRRARSDNDSNARVLRWDHIDNVVLFDTPAYGHVFLNGMTREDCWICRRRLAAVRATFPDRTFALACARCIVLVRRNYAALGEPSKETESATTESKQESKKASKKASKKESKKESKSGHKKRPKATPPTTHNQHRPLHQPPQRPQPHPTPQQPHPQQQHQQSPIYSAQHQPAPAQHPMRPPIKPVKPTAAAPLPPREPDDVSQEALQYCDAGNRMFDEDVATACQHYQRAANAQAAELAARTAAPSLRARRTLAVCHANVSAARLQLRQPSAALAAAQHALAADSSWPRPVYRLCKALIVLGRAGEAQQRLRDAVVRFPDEPELLALMAEAQRALQTAEPDDTSSVDEESDGASSEVSYDSDEVDSELTDTTESTE